MMNTLFQSILVGIVLVFCSCAPPMAGSPSFSMASDQNEKMNKYYTPISSEIKDKDCYFIGPLFLIGFGIQPNHEALLSKMLAEAKADVLLDATFKTSSFWFPYLFYNNCVSIAGTPAKLKK